MKKPKKIREIEILHNNLEELRVACKCGHTVRMPVQRDYMICTHCSNKIYNNTKAYFTYKLRKEIQKTKEIINEK
jgi:hypothetical protein